MSPTPVAAIAWGVFVLATFHAAWPRPYDDWKELVFYAGAALLACASMWKARGARAERVSAPLVLGGLYLAWAAATIPLARGPDYEGLLAWSRLVLWGAAAGMLARVAPAAQRSLCGALVACGAAIAVTTFVDQRVWSFFSPTKHMIPPLGHMSFYGHVMAVLTPMALWLAWGAPALRVRAAWAGALALLVLGLWQSASRAPLLALLAISGLAGVAALRRFGAPRGRWVAVSVLAVAALVGGLEIAASRSAHGRSLLGRVGDLGKLLRDPDFETLNVGSKGRLRTWSNTLSMIAAAPLVGSGVGSYRFVFPAHGSQPRRLGTRWQMHPHNELLHQAAELGPLGVLLLFGAAGALGTHALRALRARDPEAPAMAMALAGLGIAALSWQLDTAFLHPAGRLVCAVYVGVLWSRLRPATSGAPTRRRAALQLALVGACGLLVFAYGSSLLAAQRARATPSPEARADLTRLAWLLAPGAFTPAYQRASWALEEGDAAQRERAVGALLETYPEVPAAQFLGARALLAAGRRAEAEALASEALRRAPGFHEARCLLGELRGEPCPPDD